MNRRKFWSRCRSSLGFCICLLAPAFASAMVGEHPADAATAPVHLYRDDAGKPHTFDALSGPGGRISRLVRREVSAQEIHRITDLGLDVRFVEPTEAGASGVPGELSAALLPSDFSLVSIDGRVYGTFYVTGDRPEGAETHWVSFLFSSFNLENFDSHSAIGLLVDTRQLTENFPPTFAPAAVGNGIIFGNVSGTPGGCGEGASTDPIHNMQVESYWNGGNRIYPKSCYPWGVLYQRFRVEVRADLKGDVSYRRSRTAFDQLPMWNSPIVDTLPDRPAGTAGTLEGGGIFFAMVGDPDPDGWTAVMAFNDVRTGWF